MYREPLLTCRKSSAWMEYSVHAETFGMYRERLLPCRNGRPRVRLRRTSEYSDETLARGSSRTYARLPERTNVATRNLRGTSPRGPGTNAFGQNFGRNYFDAERSPRRLNFDSSLGRRIPRVGYLSGPFSNFDPSPPPTGVDDRTRSRAGPRRAATYVRVIGRRVARGSPRNVPAARPITGTRSRTGLRSSTPVGLGRGSKFENGPER